MFKINKIVLGLLVLAGTITSVSIAKADTTIYTLYNHSSKDHFLTPSTSDKTYLTKLGWSVDNGASWIAPSKGAAGAVPVYRLYNSISGEHFYTTSAYERDQDINSTIIVKKKKVHPWGLENKPSGIEFYSGGKEPIYRLINNKTGFHYFTPSASTRDSLKKSGWTDEGIGFYAIYPQQNWNTDHHYYTYSGQNGDVTYPQFDYLTASVGVVTAYQNNNTYAGYNNSVYNFNTALTQTAANVDYADWQARQNWSNKLNTYNLTLNQDKAAMDAAQAQVDQYQALVNQEQTYVTYDTQHNLSTVNDQALLTKDQTNLATAKVNLTAATQTYQAQQTLITNFKASGTDNVKLTYTISRSVDNKSVTVTFTQKSVLNGTPSTKTWTSSASMYYR
jgi:hypothetical protein